MPRALLSVSDKTGIVEFATGLTEAGYVIISTGGTKKALEDAGIKVMSVEDVTGFPECFGGRVKTMHPMIMGGVLFQRDKKEDIAQAKKLGIEPIDLVCVNLYPFEEGVRHRASVAARPRRDGSDVGTDEDVIELIDIGGPTLLRSAAKNHAHVTVITDPADYARVLKEISQSGNTSPQTRAELAAKVFARTAQYDAIIAGALSEEKNSGLMLMNGMHLRYGENPHQWGKYYDVGGHPRPWSVLQEEKQMSYLNILDADGAWNLVQEFSEPTAACIKHANPSGVASDKTIAEAFQRSYDTDKLSAFGVIIALNRPCTADVIRKIIDQKIFVEVLIAPKYEVDALELLKQKPKLRVIAMSHATLKSPVSFRSALGGMLVQNTDDVIITEKDMTFVTDKRPTKKQIEDLLFAWRVVKHTKSNAIVFAKNRVTVGIGAGQTSRVDSVWIAAKRAGGRAQGAVMASDAFFPFPDAVEEAAKHGVSAIIQPGGSVKDAEVFTKANALGIAMVTTGVRAFRH